MTPVRGLYQSRIRKLPRPLLGGCFEVLCPSVIRLDRGRIVSLWLPVPLSPWHAARGDYYRSEGVYPGRPHRKLVRGMGRGPERPPTADHDAGRRICGHDPGPCTRT